MDGNAAELAEQIISDEDARWGGSTRVDPKFHHQSSLLFTHRHAFTIQHTGSSQHNPNEPLHRGDGDATGANVNSRAARCPSEMIYPRP